MLKDIHTIKDAPRPTTQIGEVLEQLSDHRVSGDGLSEFSFPTYGINTKSRPDVPPASGLGFGTRTDAA